MMGEMEDRLYLIEMLAEWRSFKRRFLMAFAWAAIGTAICAFPLWAALSPEQEQQ